MKRLSVSFILSLVVISVGCTERGKPFSENAPAQGRAHKNSGIGRAEDSAKTSVSGNSDLVAQIVSGDLTSAADLVLDPARVLSPKSLLSSAIRSDLAAFNQKILNADSTHQASTEFKAVFKKYRTALSLECGEIKESCLALRYFKLASNSSPVVKLIARLSAPSETYQLLLSAVELQNRVWDPELAQLLVATMNSSATSPAELAKTKGLLESALQLSNANQTTGEEARNFLAKIQAWQLAGTDRFSLDEVSRSAFFDMVARGRFMYAANGSIDPGFVAYSEKLQAEPDSLRNRQLILQKQSLFSPKAVEAEYITSFDELIFILDGVFRNKMSPQNAVDLFASTGRSSEDLEIALRNYVRIQFVVGLYESSVEAQKIFTAKVATEDLLRHALKESSSVTRIWSALRSRLEPLKSFAVLAVAQKSTEAARLSRIESFFNSFDSSINLSSVYPQMLVLFHMLSQKSFQLSATLFSRSLDSGDIMTLLFDGKLEPLFPYSESKRPLNHFQIIHAFDIAVRTNLFAVAGINVDHFIADTIRRLNEGPAKKVEATFSKITQNFAHTKFYPSLKLMCAELDAKKAGTLPSRSVYIAELATSPYYGNLITAAFEESASNGSRPNAGQGGLQNETMGMFYLDTSYAEALEQTRLNMGANQRLGEALLASYHSYLSRFGKLSDAQIDQRTIETRTILKSIVTIREKVLAQSKQWFDEIGRCYFKAGLLDFQIEDKLLQVEQAYLRKVHKDMLKLRAPGLAPQDKASIEESYHFKGLPSQFPGRDRITDHGYMFTQVDLFIRLSRYMSKGLQTESEQFAPVAPNVVIDMGTKLDEDVAFVHNSPSQFLPFVESEKEFVDSAMKLLLGGHRASHELIHWLSYPTGRVIEWTDDLLGLSGLYRLEWDMKGTSTIVKSSDILETQSLILEYFKFTPFERELYETVKLHWKFEPGYLNRRILVTDLNNPNTILSRWGLYDLPLRMMNQDQLGFSFDPTEGQTFLHRYGYQDIGRQYYVARSSELRGEPIIPYNRDLDQSLDRSVKGHVQGEMTAIKAFQKDALAYLQSVQQRPAADQPRVDITLDDAITGPLLSEPVMASFNATLRKFHQETQHCFDPKAASCAEMQ